MCRRSHTEYTANLDLELNPALSEFKLCPLHHITIHRTCFRIVWFLIWAIRNKCQSLSQGCVLGLPFRVSLQFSRGLEDGEHGYILTESPATSEQDAGKIEHSCIPGGPRIQSWLKTDPAFKHRSFHAVLLWSRAIGKWCFFGLFWGFHSASLGYVHSNACCLSQDSLLLDCGRVTHIHESRSEFTRGRQFVVELNTTPKNVANLTVRTSFCRWNF